MAKHQKEPTVEEIARILGIKREDVGVRLDAILDPVSLYEPIYSDSGDTVCVMDQVKDSKNTDEMWLEHIALREAVSHLTERGAEDPGHALLPEQDPDGGVGGDRHLPGPGFPPGEKRSAADPQGAVNFGRGGRREPPPAPVF